KCRTQLLVIIDLPIKGDDKPAICTRHRLRALFREINDSQAAMSEAYALILRIPLANPIKAAGSHMIANAPQLGAIDRVGSIVIGVDASDAAHKFRPAQAPLVTPRSDVGLRSAVEHAIRMRLGAAHSNRVPFLA